MTTEAPNKAEAQGYYDAYKAQEEAPRWKIVAAVALAAILLVGLFLFFASPLSPVAFVLTLPLAPFIGAEIGVALAILGTGAIAAAKNGCENALLLDLCGEGVRLNISTDEFKHYILDYRKTHGKFPTVDELKEKFPKNEASDDISKDPPKLETFAENRNETTGNSNIFTGAQPDDQLGHLQNPAKPSSSDMSDLAERPPFLGESNTNSKKSPPRWTRERIERHESALNLIYRKPVSSNQPIPKEDSDDEFLAHMKQVQNRVVPPKQ